MRVSVPATSYIATLPITFIAWWFLESPRLILKILTFIFELSIHQLGYTSLFKTFFKPWKSEYRKGLVRFSIFMGMVIKGFMIFIETLIILFLLIVEFFAFIFWIFLPFLVVLGIYASLFT